MFDNFLAFLIFSASAVVCRFVIGNPADSPRMQTKYKIKNIPKTLNILLFYNTSKKPIAIHVIAFQIVNYILFIISIILLPNGIEFYKYYLKIGGITGFLIVLLPLFVETVIGMIKGENIETDNRR